MLVSVATLIAVFVHRYMAEKKLAAMPATPPEDIFSDEEEMQEGEKKKISKGDKKLIEEYLEKADVKIKVGKEDEAIKFLVQILAMDEFHQEAQHKLAMLYMQKQMFSAASALFKQLCAQTDEAVHYSHLGLALYQQNEFDGAKQAYQRAVILDPSRPQRFVSLGQVYRSLGQLNHALMAINKAMEIDQENMDFLFLTADIQKDLGNLKEAGEIVERILVLQPDSEHAKELKKEIKKLSTEQEQK